MTEHAKLADLWGAMPGLTRGLDSVEYVRRIREGIPLPERREGERRKDDKPWNPAREWERGPDRRKRDD